MEKEILKINELQIGDWLHYEYSNKSARHISFDFCVTQLRRDYSKEPLVWGESPDGGHHGNMGEVSDMQPIPLTPEILIRNGFGHIENDELCTHYYPGEERICTDMELHIGTDGKTFWLNRYHNAAYGLRYVHELQHAMKLFRIDMDIKLK